VLASTVTLSAFSLCLRFFVGLWGERSWSILWPIGLLLSPNSAWNSLWVVTFEVCAALHRSGRLEYLQRNR
jgi:hypothetical protein